jgi:tetratricopeptide (TPR) repeat protein
MSTVHRISLALTVAAIMILSWEGVSGAQVQSHADSLIKARKHFSFAVQYKKSGSLVQSYENYRQSIAYNDTVYQVHYSFADLLLKMERTDEARREFAISLRLNPAHLNSAQMLAKLYYEAAVYDSALAMFETIHRLEPDDVQVLSNIAALRTHLGMQREALAAYDELIDSGTPDESHTETAITIAIEVEEWETAKRLNDLQLEKRPDDTQCLRRGTVISLGMRNPAEAIDYAQKLKRTGEIDMSIVESIGKLSKAIGDPEIILASLELRHETEPSNTAIAGELAEMLMAAGKSGQAEVIITDALNRTPGDAKLHILMGNLFREKGDDNKAVHEYELALNDPRWKQTAQQLIWQIRPPQTESEKAEREFFRRGREQ